MTGFTAVLSIDRRVDVVNRRAIYGAILERRLLKQALSALPEAFLLPDWAAIPLTCALIAIIPFCTGLLSPSLVGIVIPLVGQVAGTLIFFSTPWFGGCCFSDLVHDSLTPLFAFFILAPLFLVYIPFGVGRALR